MCQSVHHKKDFTVVSMRVYGSFSNCHWSKHQDFVKGSAYWRVLAVRIVGEGNKVPVLWGLFRQG